MPMMTMENLRHMLMSYSPDELIYFGCKLRSPNGQIFMHDASGIVFSRAALKRFSLAALTNESICSSEKRGNEATEELGRCLTNVNVIPGNSRDELLGHRFLPFESDVHLGGVLNRSLDMHKYFLDYSYYPVIDMNVPVSLSSICFKLHSYGDCYDLYYFTYKVRMFGLSSHLNTGNEIMG
ncbi:glycoprotein-N-acetylgalactosamine 3-beta-galactosyltransferase 1 isoform X2 [Drosophila ficusphila]|uniref:glycoprotein-N-acetylgalactosamine 3-beta-galactosyltransferase 1 isoform X2 n=1 Tax=Drosophila ficusphila TaxID=30025 RepID=UPI0007E86EB4|nr:glycoprotein-N-acetylgalactosamine 3-beta-galactosyltransferase 1 isoform X2 [Drosophila ficusphila]